MNIKKIAMTALAGAGAVTRVWKSFFNLSNT